MFKHLLVPLDGSNLAESALPAAAFIAQKLNASVTLIHIIEQGAAKEIHGDRHLTDPDEACDYLAEVGQRAFPASVPLERHVHTEEEKNIARSIVEHSAEMKPDLIVMCTHGNSGLHDFLVGSIAQQVIAFGETPVLLVRPNPDNPAQSFHLERLLVPLDGNPEHEPGLPVAAELAAVCQADLHLLMVVPTYGDLKGEQAATSRLLPGSTAAMLELAEMGGVAYLRERLAQLQPSGISLAGEVERGEPVDTITEVAQRVKADLVVLSTHGKTGMDAFWSGSVTPKVSSKTEIPLLLVPVAEK